jgi:mono/diheme cytochrome c family protein
MKPAVVTVAFTLALVSTMSARGAARRPAPSSDSPAAARQTLDQYCVTCHNDRLKTAGLSLQSIDLSHIAADDERLEKVVKKLRIGAMPPSGVPRPDAAASTSLMHWLEDRLDQAASAHPNPGRTESLHRLNHVEYANAVRDLLGLEGMDFSTLLPGDDASYGFDNIAGVLGMSPTHLEQYLRAARTVSRYAVGDVTLPPTGETHMTRPDLSQDSRLEGMPLGTRGGILVRRYFPVDATYLLRFQAFSGVGLAEEEPNDIEMTIDGNRVFYEEMAQKRVRHVNLGQDVQANTDWEIRLPIRAGLHDVRVAFVQTTYGQLDDLLQPYLRPPGMSTFRLTRLGGYAGPYVGQIAFTGPFDATGPGETPARRRIFTCRPLLTPASASQVEASAAEAACARQILTALARRAYRRPVDKDDVDALLAAFQKGREGTTFDLGIQMALERLLASPDFLFRLEEDPTGAAAGRPYQISDLELASRLSFFLWSSLPDDELLDAASRHRLREHATLEHEVTRMLADPKAAAFVDNFAGQWLRLRALSGVDRNTYMFPDFDDNLREAMRRETELFVGSIVREDRSVIDLLDADYTFVNERLARHYGLPNVYGSQFRRLTIADPNRRGLLGHASVLTVTSQANRTSPVTRGKWILDNFIGAPPPPPPPDVPALEQTAIKGTLRQRMELHRKNPACAGCHRNMDPLGFALENFDPLGQWRTSDEGLPVDTAGTLPDGTTFRGVAGLRAALLARPDVFATTLTEKLLTYALGRGVEYYDAPAVRQIVRTAGENNYRFSRLILGIVSSAPFQMRLPAPQVARSGAN